MKVFLSRIRTTAFRPHFILIVAALSFSAGCSSFKYTPKHDQTYGVTSSHAGLAIATGQDSRPEDEKQPGWAKNAEPIVARALADEIKYAKLFERVKIHADSLNLKKYSEIVQLRVIKFRCADRQGFFEKNGRRILEYQGIRGALIADSIPTKYIAEVEVEFEILDAASRQSLFRKTYSATENLTANGYQGKGPLIQKTSAALETVVTRFVADLSMHLPKR